MSNLLKVSLAFSKKVFFFVLVLSICQPKYFSKGIGTAVFLLRQIWFFLLVLISCCWHALQNTTNKEKTILFSYCFSLKWIAAAFVKKRQNKVASVLNASFNTDLFKEASISLIKYAPKTFSKNLLSDKVHINYLSKRDCSVFANFFSFA